MSFECSYGSFQFECVGGSRVCGLYIEKKKKNWQLHTSTTSVVILEYIVFCLFLSLPQCTSTCVYNHSLIFLLEQVSVHLILPGFWFIYIQLFFYGICFTIVTLKKKESQFGWLCWGLNQNSFKILKSIKIVNTYTSP